LQTNGLEEEVSFTLGSVGVLRRGIASRSTGTKKTPHRANGNSGDEADAALPGKGYIYPILCLVPFWCFAPTFYR